MNVSDFFPHTIDPRVTGRCRHLLSDILGLVLLGVIADCDDFEQIADFGQIWQERLKEDFGFSFPSGVPSHDTLERLFNRLDTSSLHACYTAFVKAMASEGKQLIFDGKSVRSTVPKGKSSAKLQIVSCWVAGDFISLRQESIDEKGSEIHAVQEMVDSLDLEGAVVTADALHCQQETVRAVLKKKGTS